MLSCRDLAQRADRYLDGDLSLRQRLEVRLHMFLCKHCTRYVEQLRLTIGALRRSAAVTASPTDALADRLLRAAQTAEPKPGGVPREVIVYTTPWCPYCRRAKALLRRKHISYREIDVARDPARRQEMSALAAGRATMPQIFIGGHGIGGCDELQALDASGELDHLLGRA